MPKLGLDYFLSSAIQIRIESIVQQGKRVDCLPLSSTVPSDWKWLFRQAKCQVSALCLPFSPSVLNQECSAGKHPVPELQHNWPCVPSCFQPEIVPPLPLLSYYQLQLHLLDLNPVFFGGGGTTFQDFGGITHQESKLPCQP